MQAKMFFRAGFRPTAVTGIRARPCIHARTRTWVHLTAYRPLSMLASSGCPTREGGTAPGSLRAEWREIIAGGAPCPRSSHQMSAVGSCVFIFGGEGGPAESHFGYGMPLASTLYCLDLAAPHTWQKFTYLSAPSARLGHGQAAVQCGDEMFLYVFGGRQPEVEGTVYDGSEKIRSLNDMHRVCIAGKGVGRGWEKVECTGDVPSVRSFLQMVALGEDLYMFGGRARFFFNYRSMPTANAEDPCRSKVPRDATHRDLSDATLRFDLALGTRGRHAPKGR